MKSLLTVLLIFICSFVFSQTIKHDTLEILRPDLIKVIKVGGRYYKINIELKESNDFELQVIPNRWKIHDSTNPYMPFYCQPAIGVSRIL